jgi:hypothetical protein
VLVRRVKDQAFDDAMLTLVSAMLDLRTRTENELLAEIDARLKPIGAAEKVL